jgi:hypothetical protein
MKILHLATLAHSSRKPTHVRFTKKAGWPDEFVKKSPKMQPNHFWQNEYIIRTKENSNSKFRCWFCIFLLICPK